MIALLIVGYFIIGIIIYHLVCVYSESDFNPADLSFAMTLWPIMLIASLILGIMGAYGKFLNKQVEKRKNKVDKLPNLYIIGPCETN